MCPRPAPIAILTAGLTLLFLAAATAPAQPSENPALRPTPVSDSTPPTNDAAGIFLASLEEKRQTFKGLLAAGHKYLQDLETAQAARGLSQSSLEQIASEAAQILGQIVVDRASAQAFSVLKRKLMDFLDCANQKHRKVRFAETCSVLDSLRLEDIATSPPAFYHAVAADGVTYLLSQAGSEDFLLQPGVAAVLVEGMRRGRITPGAESANLLVSEVLIQTFAKGDVLTDGQKALVIGATAYLQCRAQNPVALGQCAVNDIVNQLCDRALSTSENVRGEIRIGAKSLAGDLIVASTRMKDKLPDPQERFKYAARSLFTAVCMNAGSSLGCGARGADFNQADRVRLANLALAQALVVGAVGGDAQAVVVVLQKVIEVEQAEDRELDARALRFIAALLDYAATYTDEAGAKDAHERRTKVLESLTREMTNRTGRQGDTIVSFGGSLRLTGGARFRGSDQTLFGPLGLPLGFGLQAYRPKGGAGWHLELGILDLGQYVAFQKGGEVQEPKLADALAPSISVGRFWGQELPWFVAVTGGYSPHYQFESGSTSQRGAWFAGVAFGIYVPLFDLN